MRSPTVQDSDLSARTKIREAALSLFGTEGFAVSVRAISDAAGCSPGLVIHHFGNKDGLREAVDQSVMDTLLQRFEGIPSELPADELSRTMGDVFSDVIGASPVVRQYMRRSLLEANPGEPDDFRPAARSDRSQPGSTAASRWVAGDLRPAVASISTPLRDPRHPAAGASHTDATSTSPSTSRTSVEQRTAANYDLLAHGMFLASADTTPERSKS